MALILAAPSTMGMAFSFGGVRATPTPCTLHPMLSPVCKAFARPRDPLTVYARASL